MAAGCHSSGEGKRDDPAPRAPPSSTVAPSASAPTIAPRPDPIDDAGDLDLRAPPYADELQRCASEINAPRLGYMSSFLIHVDIDTGDAASPTVTVSGMGLVTHVATPGTCFERLGRRLAEGPRSRGRHFRIDINGPSPRYVITQR